MCLNLSLAPPKVTCQPKYRGSIHGLRINEDNSVTGIGENGGEKHIGYLETFDRENLIFTIKDKGDSFTVHMR